MPTRDWDLVLFDISQPLFDPLYLFYISDAILSNFYNFMPVDQRVLNNWQNQLVDDTK